MNTVKGRKSAELLGDAISSFSVKAHGLWSYLEKGREGGEKPESRLRSLLEQRKEEVKKQLDIARRELEGAGR